MFDTQSDYAMNKKDPDAIVYMDATGSLIRLTPKDFSSPKEFQWWKEWSDSNYHELEKENHIFLNHTVPAFGEGIDVQSPEDVLIEGQEQEERQELQRLLMKGLDSCLTQTQRRRLWLHCVHRLTVRQISVTENATFKNVAKCIVAAKKKLKKFLNK